MYPPLENSTTRITIIVRSRKCTNPRPQYDGKDCVGESLQNRSCYLRKCVAVPEQNETIISNSNPEAQTESSWKGNNTIVSKVLLMLRKVP